MSRLRTEPLRVGLVGARRAVSTCRGFGACPETIVTTVCDTDEAAARQAATNHQLQSVQTSYEAMLDSGEIDIVVIATPMHLHAPMAVAALERGIHALSEVTAATSLEQCAALVRAARASTAVYMMAENYCYLKPNVLVGAMVRAGLFGRPYYAEGAYIHELEKLHFDAAGQPTWRHTWQVGRRGCTYPTHSLGPILQWFGDRVASITCLGSGSHTPPPRRMDDSTVMLCQLAGGGLVSIRNDMISKRPHNMTLYSLQGTSGCYESSRGDQDRDKIWLTGRSADNETWQALAEYEAEFLPAMWRTPPPEVAAAGHGGSDYYVVRDFVDAIVTGTRPPIDAETAVEFTLPGLISEESIERGGAPRLVPDIRRWDGVGPLA